MPFNIFCSHCGHRITVHEHCSAGAVVCPQCGESVSVYQPKWTPQPAMRQVEPSEPVPSSFSIGSLLTDSWNIGTQCWQPFLIMGLILGGVNLLVTIPMMFAPLIAPLFQGPAGSDFLIAVVGTGLTYFLVVSLVMVWLYCGAYAYSLAAVRGEQPPVSMLFGGMKHFWGVLIAGANITVIMLCVVFVIFMITCVPPIFYFASGPEPSPVMVLPILSITFGGMAMAVAFIVIATLFWLSYFFVVDRGQGAGEAMRSSYRFVWPQFWTVFGSVFLIGIISAIAGMIPFVGQFVQISIMLGATTMMYLKITGQKHGLSP